MEAFVIRRDEMIALKKMQVQGIKNLFNMHYYVPDVVMLCELGIKDIEFEIIKILEIISELQK